MKSNGYPEIKEVLDVPHYRPAVSVILPLRPKYGLEAETHKELKYAIDKTARLLQHEYAAELVETVLRKINTLISGSVFPLGKKGLVLYASPLFAKMYFLDTEVPERIIIDDSFEIRDLIFNRKEEKHYLLFVLSSEKCKLYMHNGQQLMPVKLEAPNTIDAYWNDDIERVSNFTDPVVYKAKQVEKFIRQMDKELKKEDSFTRNCKFCTFIISKMDYIFNSLIQIVKPDDINQTNISCINTALLILILQNYENNLGGFLQVIYLLF